MRPTLVCAAYFCSVFLILLSESLLAQSPDKVLKPWGEYPTPTIQAKRGSHLLCPTRANIQLAIEQGVSHTPMDYCHATLLEAGATESTVTMDGSTSFLIPNDLVVVIPAGQRASIGDIVLTWHPSASPPVMVQAIVVGGTDAAPLVRLSDPRFESAESHRLVPDSFMILSEPGQVGTMTEVTVREESNFSKKVGRIVGIVDSDLLILTWNNRIGSYRRNAVEELPLHPRGRVGDFVKFHYEGSMVSGKLVKKIPTIGRVVIESDQNPELGQIEVPMGEYFFLPNR